MSGDLATVRGRNLAFAFPDTTERIEPEVVLFGGQRAHPEKGITSTSVMAKVPEGLKPGTVYQVEVMRNDGALATNPEVTVKVAGANG